MNTILSIIAFAGTAFSLGSAIYIFISDLRIRKMQMVNRGLNVYVKKKEYLLMKNGGENPCETKKEFSMPLFSQESDYIIRRKAL